MEIVGCDDNGQVFKLVAVAKNRDLDFKNKYQLGQHVLFYAHLIRAYLEIIDLNRTRYS